MLWFDRFRLKSKNHTVRLAAIRKTGQNRDLKAVDPLVYVLDADPQPENRSAAAAALAQIGEKRAAQSLLRILGDPNAAVSTAAAMALDTAQWADPGNQKGLVALRLGRLEEAGTEYLSCASGKAEIGPLIETLQKGESRSRIWAAGTLAKIGDRTAIPALSKAFDDPDGDVQTAAVAALGALIPPAFDALGQALEHPSRHVSCAAAHLLGQLRQPGTSAVLASALRHDDPELRMNIAEALISVGDSAAVEALIGLAIGSDQALSIAALVGLTKLAPSKAAEPLWEVAATCAKGVKPFLLATLAAIGDPRVVGPLLESLRQEIEHETERHGWLESDGITCERAREGPRRLIRIFRNQAANMSSFDLDTAAGFADISAAKTQESTGGERSKSNPETIDYSEVRKLARAEIDRRAKAKRQYR